MFERSVGTLNPISILQVHTVGFRAERKSKLSILVTLRGRYSLTVITDTMQWHKHLPLWIYVVLFSINKYLKTVYIFPASATFRWSLLLGVHPGRNSTVFKILRVVTLTLLSIAWISSVACTIIRSYVVRTRTICVTVICTVTFILVYKAIQTISSSQCVNAAWLEYIKTNYKTKIWGKNTYSR